LLGIVPSLGRGKTTSWELPPQTGIHGHTEQLSCMPEKTLNTGICNKQVLGTSKTINWNSRIQLMGDLSKTDARKVDQTI